MGPYAHALALGTDVSEEEKQQVAEKLHEYTGLPVDYVLKANLRVSGRSLRRRCRMTDDLTTGRLDTRFSGPNLDPLSENAEYDPQSGGDFVGVRFAVQSVRAARSEVRRRANLSAGCCTAASRSGTSSTTATRERERERPDLAEAMKTNPRLKVMVNGGYYDLATPFFAAQYEDKHLPIPQSLAKNIEYDWYESGHMVYVRDECVKQLHDRVAAFIKSSRISVSGSNDRDQAHRSDGTRRWEQEMRGLRDSAASRRQTQARWRA